MNRFSRIAVAALILVTACKDEVEVPLYEPVQVVRRDIVVSADAAGVIEPILVVEVKSKASGEITDLRAETGDIVERGELLVQVDPRDPRNQVAQAQADTAVARAQLVNAESQKRRADDLFRAQLLSEQEYESSNLQVANARAQLVRAERTLEAAEIQLQDTEVRAPISGTIIEKTVERGQIIASATSQVSGGTTLLRMADLSQVQVRALVDETDIGKISAGMRASIAVDAYPNSRFEGVVLKIEPQSTTNQNVTMFPVLIRIPNPDGRLRPGMNAQVELQVSQRSGVLAIPNSALRTQRDVASAAAVLGIDPAQVEQTLAAADSATRLETARNPQQTQQASQGGRTEPVRPAEQQPAAVPGAQQAQRQGGPGGPGGPGGAGGAGGFQMPLPPGVTQEQWDAIRTKRRNQEALTPAESTTAARVTENLQRLRDSGQLPSMGAPGGQPGGQAAGAPQGPPAAAADGPQLPPGVTQAQLTAIFTKMRNQQPLTAAEQAIMTRMRSMAGSGGNRRRQFGAGNRFEAGGNYIVFVLRDGQPTPVRIRTGITDLDYSEIVTGLTEQDTVLLLPSASLINSQAEMRDRFQRMTGGGGVPGMRSNTPAAPAGGRR